MSEEQIDELSNQLQMLKELSTRRADTAGALESIRDCARDIERAAHDLAADYARDIRVAAERLAAQPRSARRVSETAVGEFIERLEEYLDLVRHGPEDLAGLRPWG